MATIFSIIVPVYNTKPYLRKCIDSILDQSYKDFELILVDDGSTDGSSDICDEYSSSDNRVTVIHKTNEGAASARKTGLQVAIGEYVLCIDSDDYVDLDYFEKL